MESGSSSEAANRVHTWKGQNLGSILPKIQPFVPKRDHSPRELKSWAKRTGFVSNFSGETGTSVNYESDLEKGGGHVRNGSSSPKIEIDPVLGRMRNRGDEIETDSGSGNRMERGESDEGWGLREETGRSENERKRIEVEPILRGKNEHKTDGPNGNSDGVINGNGNVGYAAAPELMEPKKEDVNVRREVGIDMYPGGGVGEERGGGGMNQPSTMKCGLRDNPGFG